MTDWRKVDRSQIVTSYNPPPIPVRNSDWSAVLKSYDAGDPIGYGPTEQAAIESLLDAIEAEETWIQSLSRTK